MSIQGQTAWPIKLKFNEDPPWIVALKFCSQYFGHMTKMAAMPIYGKNPSKIFSRTGEPIWYVASGTPPDHSLLK